MQKLLLLLSLIFMIIILTSGSSMLLNDDYELEYIENSALIDSIYTPTVPQLKLRESPTLKGKLIQMLIPGEKLILLGEGKFEIIDGDDGRWVNVKTIDNKVGWCFNAYLKILEQAKPTGDFVSYTSGLLNIKINYPKEWGTYYGILWKNSNSQYLYSFFITTKKIYYSEFKNFIPIVNNSDRNIIHGVGSSDYKETLFQARNFFGGLKKNQSFENYFKLCYPKVYDYKIDNSNKAIALMSMKHDERYFEGPSKVNSFTIKQIYFINLPNNKIIKGLQMEFDFDQVEKELNKIKDPKDNDSKLDNYKQEYKISTLKENFNEDEKKILIIINDFYNSLNVVEMLNDIN